MIPPQLIALAITGFGKTLRADQPMKERVTAEMTKCVKAIEALEKMLAELQDGNQTD